MPQVALLDGREFVLILDIEEERASVSPIAIRSDGFSISELKIRVKHERLRPLCDLRRWQPAPSDREIENLKESETRSREMEEWGVLLSKNRRQRRVSVSSGKDNIPF